MSKSFAALYKKRESTPEYQAERMGVSFLAELNARMVAQGMSNSDLARAAGVSPAYITKLFRGPSNISLATIAKLALAVGCQPHVHLATEGAQVRWFDVMHSRDEISDRSPPISLDFEKMKRVLEHQKPQAVEASNDHACHWEEVYA